MDNEKGAHQLDQERKKQNKAIKNFFNAQAQLKNSIAELETNNYEFSLSEIEKITEFYMFFDKFFNDGKYKQTIIDYIANNPDNNDISSFKLALRTGAFEWVNDKDAVEFIKEAQLSLDKRDVVSKDILQVLNDALTPYNPKKIFDCVKKQNKALIKGDIPDLIDDIIKRVVYDSTKNKKFASSKEQDAQIQALYKKYNEMLSFYKKDDVKILKLLDEKERKTNKSNSKVGSGILKQLI